MLTVIDEQIQFGQEAFRTIGGVRAIPAALMNSQSLGDADLLIVRSVTRVDESLLGNSRIKFVGSVTSGVDHIDFDCLQKRNIAFANAPGCNAASVAEYVMAALCFLREKGLLASDARIGVVGVGHVGRQVARKACGLGFAVLKNDPPAALKGENEDFLPLDELMSCDVLTLHVPLIEDGPFRTRRFFDNARLRQIKRGGVLINTSRGEVVDEPALISCLQDGHLSGAVIDVWTGEPRINTNLLQRAMLGTPHIAGYSLEGRTAGTIAVYRAACRFLGVPETWQCQLPSENQSLILAAKESVELSAGRAVLQVYDIHADDARLRAMLSPLCGEKDKFFIELRKRYSIRREFSSRRVRTEGLGSNLLDKLRALGFTCENALGIQDAPAPERTG